MKIFAAIVQCVRFDIGDKIGECQIFGIQNAPVAHL